MIAAQGAADKARREAQQVSSLQLPRAEALHQQQMSRLRAEVAKAKEAAKAAEEALAGKENEVTSLKQCIHTLKASEQF